MGLSAEQLKESLDALAAIEPAFATALANASYPEPRAREPGYETLLRTIVGQQVSVARRRRCGPSWKMCLATPRIRD